MDHEVYHNRDNIFLNQKIKNYRTNKNSQLIGHSTHRLEPHTITFSFISKNRITKKENANHFMGSLDAPISAENGTAPAAGHGKSPLTDGGMRAPPSDSVPEYELVKRRRSSVLPLEVGTRVMCRWRDGKYHPVKVIERRRVHGCGPNDYEYYVHYTECMNLIFILCSFIFFNLMKFRVLNCEPCLILGFVV